MARQLRLNDPAVIRQRAGEFLGKKINIVMKDSRVGFGTLAAVTADGIVLINMRLRKSHIPFTQIEELYFDTII